jgi:nicotinate-nucleotide adenylyltransferase
VAAAGAVRAARRLDEVLFVPASEAPHKRDAAHGPAPFADRLAMVGLAIRGCAGLVASDLEGRRPGPSYTIDTVLALRERRPAAEAELLVGADMLADLPRWRRAGDLVARVTVVGFGRPGEDEAAARRTFRAAFPDARFAWVDVSPVEAASREIRARVARGDPCDDLLHPAVAAHIRKNGLYGTGGLTPGAGTG